LPCSAEAATQRRVETGMIYNNRLRQACLPDRQAQADIPYFKDSLSIYYKF
jgi:hypothetical protein